MSVAPGASSGALPSAAITGPIEAPRSVEAVPLIPTASSTSLAAKYRGATVEDLQLSPAVCVSRSASIEKALNVAHDHDYSQLPLVGDNRKMLGYVDVASLRERLEKGTSQPSDRVDSAMVAFWKREAATNGEKRKFTIITPQTDLADLEVFLQSEPFAIVTDLSRAFVLGVVTRDDLEKFVVRRGGASNGNAAQPVAGGSSILPTAAQSQMMARRAEEEARKNRTLSEFLLMLDGYTPLIPDEVTDFYLERAGFECQDVRLKRLVSLAAEKFVSDIASDAFQYARIRSNAGPGGRSKGGAAAGGAAGQGAKDRSRTVLTMDDLSAALSEYGINARRSEFFR
ncbi:hypothetical protein K437DRAFT_256171 [Tilletiaria anomala UBC 951]|uniref:CBS domain-containing protein n=1 Tax=Tilletiaria anomala (strain ATCC 24038 / CBS 436.72 / UBC 951) TaxID=1037660 RepID=A0A066W6Q1_TILAU|nr:uncharacterized protein K437DRAFT_256171 [Tilletiaria anomala UBC 951]KDN46445.1 hypothetical protein K437DRAFT_256171 [Tilletiaria anomala UBC 951]